MIDYFESGYGKKIISIYKNFKSTVKYLTLYTILITFLIQEAIAFIFGFKLIILAEQVIEEYKLEGHSKFWIEQIADFLNSSNIYIFIGAVVIFLILSFLNWLDKKGNKKLQNILESNTVPKLKANYFAREDEQKIIQQVQQTKILQIVGISGIGKSELTKKIAKSLKNDFTKIIWVNGDDANNREPTLSSIHVETFDTKINIENYLKSKKILLILDNFNSNLKTIEDEFLASNKNNSICLITSLQKDLDTEKIYKLGYLSDELSYKILGIENETSKKIVNYCKGYPLILQLIRDAINDEEYTWNEILSIINKQSLSKLDDDRNNELAIRILKKLLKLMQIELETIHIIDSQTIAKGFLENILGIPSVKKLEKRNIIETRQHYFYIHQIILDSINNSVTNPNIEQYYKKLGNFLVEGNDNKTAEYYNLLFTNNQHLDKIYNQLDYTNSLKKIILYSKVQARDIEQGKWYLEEILNYDLSANTKLNILLEIEKVEIELSDAKFKFSYKENDKYIEISKEKIAYLEGKLSKIHLNDIKTYLEHHIGKICKNIKDYDKALSLFSKVIEKDNKANYARLQIARIYTWYLYTDENKQKLDKVLHELLDNKEQWEEESLTILLATYELISENKLEKYRDEYIMNQLSYFKKNLFYSLHFGFEQPYELLAKLSNHLAYKKTDDFLKICEELPFPAQIDSNNKIRYAFAVIQASYYKILKENNFDQHLVKEAYQNAETYFKGLKLNDYQRGYFIDFYINAEKWDEADILISQNKQRNTFYFQKVCKIKRGKKLYIEAIKNINLAIKDIKKTPKFTRYLNAMYHDKAEVFYEVNKYSKAILNLNKAIELLKTNGQDDKLLKKWNDKLVQWKNVNKI